MKTLTSILATLAIVGCAGYKPITDPPKEAAAPVLPTDYCTIAWDNNGNQAFNCVQYKTKEEMEQYILMSRQDCIDTSGEPDPRAPKYKSDK